MARLETARDAKEEFFAGTERAIGNLPLDLRRRLHEATAVVADTEVYADSVEAAVLTELAARSD